MSAPRYVLPLGNRGRSLAVLTTWTVVVVVAVLLPTAGIGDYWVRQLTLVGLLSLVVSSLNLSFGYAGELALGQAALYAAGAYAGGYTAIYITNNLFLAMLSGVIAALALGILSGVPGLRLGGWTLAIASFFLVMLVSPVIKLFGDRLGGDVGLQAIPVPVFFGHDLDGSGIYVLVVVVTALWFAIFRNLVVSRFGIYFRILRHNPIAASAAGVSPYWTKLKAYSLAAVPVGVAGALFAYLQSYISPTSFGLDYAIVVLAASILGGSASVYAALLGAAVLQIAPAQISSFQTWSLLAYGAFLVLGGLLLRNGVAGEVNRLVARLVRTRPAVEQTGVIELPPLDGKTLVVDDVSCSFGGVRALSNVSFQAHPGCVTALIGPNGSGKTTAMNLISGFYRPNNGRILLGDDDLTGFAPYRVARRGVGRTFQIPMVPEGLTVLDVVMSGRFHRSPLTMIESILRLPRHWRVHHRDRVEAMSILASLGLADRAFEVADSLAIGTRRIVELARAIAGGSAVLLLDEVASGLDEGEIAELVTAVQRTRDAGATIILVEHNFPLVRALADDVVVLADGEVLTQGTITEIERHPDVLQHYLGRGGGVSGTRTGRAVGPHAAATVEGGA